MSTFIREAYLHIGEGTGGPGRPWKPALVNGSKVEPQRNNWSCGPMALRYCLLAYGLDVDARRIARLAGSTRAGTNESQMSWAAVWLKSSFKNHTRKSPDAIKRLILDNLKRGRPLIACVEQWAHWIAVLHHTRRGYLVFDSSRPGPVIRLRSWKWLERQLRYTKTEERPLYAVATVGRPVQGRRK